MQLGNVFVTATEEFAPTIIFPTACAPLGKELLVAVPEEGCGNVEKTVAHENTYLAQNVGSGIQKNNKRQLFNARGTRKASCTDMRYVLLNFWRQTQNGTLRTRITRSKQRSKVRAEATA